MKKKIFRRAAAMAMAGAMMLPGAFVTPAWAAEEDSFYKELADLVKQEDDSNYFDAMELQLGSNVLTVDGEAQVMDVAPDLKNDRTMLPIRAVAEATGAEVDYDPSSETVLITGAHGDEIQCPVGAETMTVNDSVMELDSAAYIKEGRTYLPVRAVSEALDMEVAWDQSTSTVTLTAPYQSARILAQADNLDISGLGAEKAINDGKGMWVLQFATPSDAKAAEETLQGMGVAAEPDLYVPPIMEPLAEEEAAASGYYTWGAMNSGFDKFIADNAGLLQGSSGIVAVVDSGVDSSHFFLRGKMTGGKDFVDGDSVPDDQNSHGTHVAGTIIDCVGSANVKIMPVRVLNAQGSGFTSHVAAGIRYAADNGADVINLSLSGAHSNIKEAAIQYAVNKGCTVVIAAGNDNRNTMSGCPSDMTLPGTIIVAAGDSKRQKAAFSNYGANIDLMAPGVGIKAAIPGGGYGSKSGTSMATPHVAAAAMLLDMAWDKNLSPAQVEEKVHTATVNGRFTDQQVGYGFLDLSRADVPEKAAPSVTLTLKRAEQLNETTMRLSVAGSYTDTTLTGVRFYAGKSAGSLEQVYSGSFKTSSNSFTNVYDYNIEDLESGTYYYQFGIVAGDDVEYKSEVGTFEVKKKALQPEPEPQPEPVEPQPEPVEPQPTQPEPVTENTFIGYAFGTNGGLAINDKPAVSPGWSNQIGLIPEGASFTVYPDRASGSWYWVTYNGVSGYAHKSYITTSIVTRQGVVRGTNGGLAINDKPAVSPGWSNQIGVIPEGATCTVYPDRVSGSWYWVTYNGVSGYAHKNYIRMN